MRARGDAEDEGFMFSQLSPAQIERLALLLEELGEAQQAVGKILRHGYASRDPRNGQQNTGALERELGDVLYAIQLLCDAGDVNQSLIDLAKRKKPERAEPYLHHQADGR